MGAAGLGEGLRTSQTAPTETTSRWGPAGVLGKPAVRPRASGNGEKGPTDPTTAKPPREPGPGGDVAPRQGKEAIRFLEARPHPPCEAERTRSVASCALKGYAGKLGGLGRKAGKVSRWAKGYVLGTPGFPESP